MKINFKNLLPILIIFFSFFVAQKASALDCPTDIMYHGVFCASTDLKSWNKGTASAAGCNIEATCGTDPNGDFSVNCSSNTCGLSCNGGFTVCSGGTYGTFCKTNIAPVSPCNQMNTCANTCTGCISGYTLCGSTCTATVSPTAPCSNYDTCNSRCTACNSGYSFCASTYSCTATQTCLPGQTFDPCANSCVGSASILKLGADSVSGSNVIQSLNPNYSTLFIPQLNRVGIGSSTIPSTFLQIFGDTSQSVNISGGRIGGLDLTPMLPDEAVPLGYLQANYPSSSASLWGGSLGGNVWNLNSGNVGIGNTGPSAKLDVYRNDASYAVNIGDTNNRAVLKLRASNAGTEQLTVSRGVNVMQLQSVGTDGSTAYNISLNPFGGNVGIGTATPTSKLHTITPSSGSDDSNNAAIFQSTGGNGIVTIRSAGTSSFAALYGSLGSDIVGAIDFRSTSGDMSFWTNPVGSNSWIERMRILNSNGNVGIGTSNPINSKLDVGGTSQINGAIYPFVGITNNSDNIQALQLQNKSTGTGAEMRFITAANDNSYLAFTQPSTGNTGTFFGVTKSSGSFIFNSGNGGAERNIYLGTLSASTLNFGTNNLIRATILSNGNFGVGTTTPNTILKIAGSGQIVNVSGARIGGLDLTPLTADEAVPLGYLQANYLDKTSSGVAKFIGYTTTKYDGNDAGSFTNANTYCNAQYSGSHVCTIDEIFNTINRGLASTITASSTEPAAWLNSGPPGYIANVNDCEGWTKNSAGTYGNVWYRATTTSDGYGSLGICGDSYKYACCK
jgi:hypothetical protein